VPENLGCVCVCACACKGADFRTIVPENLGCVCVCVCVCVRVRAPTLEQLCLRTRGIDPAPTPVSPAGSR
jgi:hypothetical protein